jgi:hypothetical protein
MKSLILSASLIFAASTTFASPLFVEVPGLIDPKVTVQMPGELTTVQPRASIEFGFESCGRFNFEADVKKEDGILYVTILHRGTMIDCMALGKVHKYKFPLSADFANGQLVKVTNPIRIQYIFPGDR